MGILTTKTEEMIMKNFNVLILVLLLTFGVSSAQTIGDHLNFIKQEKPGGVLKPNDDKSVYFYHWQDDKARWVYLVNVNLICFGIMINPVNAESRNILVRVFDEDPSWIKVNLKTWKYYRNDNIVLQTTLEYVDDVGPTFIISEIR